MSNAFDIYLNILSRVKNLVEHVLGRDAPNWHMKYGCPACGYQLEDEPALIPARLHAMDGNNSAKRLDDNGGMDPRTFKSKFFLSPADVDKFKDEVQSRKSDDPDCGDRWKAANAVDNPEALTVFDQTGIFLLTCRHHIVEKIAEMVKSGEL